MSSQSGDAPYRIPSRGNFNLSLISEPKDERRFLLAEQEWIDYVLRDRAAERGASAANVLPSLEDGLFHKFRDEIRRP